MNIHSEEILHKFQVCGKLSGAVLHLLACPGPLPDMSLQVSVVEAISPLHLAGPHSGQFQDSNMMSLNME